MKTSNKIILGVLVSVVFFGLSIFSMNTATNTAGAFTLVQMNSQSLLWDGIASVVCTSSGQLCNPKYNISLTTTVATPLLLDYRIPSGNCSSINVDIYLDDTLSGSTGWIGRGSGVMDGTLTIPLVNPGSHIISLKAKGRVGGCNVGRLHSWSLPLKIYGNVQTTTNPALVASCSAYPSTALANQSVTFSTTRSGGTGSYTYQWTGSCTGTSQNCSNSYSTTGNKTANVTVTSGNQAFNAVCQVTVNPVQTTYTQNSYQACVGTNRYWYDSFGNQGSYVGTCNTNTGNYIYHNTSRCSGNGVYWFDSNGNQQDLYQACNGNQTCPITGSVCVNQNINYGNSLITILVRNLSSGNLNWSNSIAASPSDVIQFQVTVLNNSGQNISNATVRNVLPANLIDYNNLTLDGIANSGNIINGLLIGNLSIGQTRTIAYQTRVAGLQNFSFGTTTLTDNVYLANTDTSFNYSNANASIIVTRGNVLGATDVSTGLTNNPLIDSFFLPLVILIAGIWLFRYRKKLIF